MFLFFLGSIILLAIVFLTGLIVFVRSLILKRNMGCGLSGLFMMIITALIVIFHSEIYEIFTSQSEDEFIHRFENMTESSYPVSGKIVEKIYNEAGNVLGDYENVAIIEMNNFDYKRLLQDIQSNKNFEIDSVSQKERITPSFLLKKQIPVNDFDYVYKKKLGHECDLWFHKNKQMIVYEDINY